MARVLSFWGANASVDTSRPLTYVIYWRPRGGPNGHSAMIIDSSKINATDALAVHTWLDDQAKTNYVSWSGDAATSNPLVFAGASSTFREDMQAGWGGQTVNKPGSLYDREVLPTRWVALRGLDIAAMHAEWDAIRTKPGGHWKLIDKNCASVVARVLKEGCRSVGAKGSWATRNPLFWTPDGVMRFAKSLTNHVHDSSSG
jgi:hypothetical protein